MGVEHSNSSSDGHCDGKGRCYLIPTARQHVSKRDGGSKRIPRNGGGDNNKKITDHAWGALLKYLQIQAIPESSLPRPEEEKVW